MEEMSRTLLVTLLPSIWFYEVILPSSFAGIWNKTCLNTSNKLPILCLPGIMEPGMVFSPGSAP